MTVSFAIIFSKGDDIRNWQDGLRALLPNINISFSGTVARNGKKNYFMYCCYSKELSNVGTFYGFVSIHSYVLESFL